MSNNKLQAVTEAYEEAFCMGNDSGALMAIGVVWELGSLGEITLGERNEAMRQMVCSLKDAKLAERDEYRQHEPSTVTNEIRGETVAWLEKLDNEIVRDAASFLRALWSNCMTA